MEKLHQNHSAEFNTLPIDAELEPFSSSEKENEGVGTMSRRDERVLAFHFLYAVEQLDYTSSLEQIVRTFRSEYEVNVEDKSFAIEIAREVIENREMLDTIMVPFLKNWKLDRLGLCTRLILRLAMWELMQPDAIPSIIINEAIELAKGFAEKDAYKFINGILDEFVKSRQPSVEQH